MSFNRAEVAKLLVRCGRRGCVCHRFCGVKIETDHIVPFAETEDDTIENAIPLCFDCHAEVHHYNDRHPRGRKFTPEELRWHRDAWLKFCDEYPGALATEAVGVTAGPLQAVIDELEYNRYLSTKSTETDSAAPFLDRQFHRAIEEGALSILEEETRTATYAAYRHMALANTRVAGVAAATSQGEFHKACKHAHGITGNAHLLIERALRELESHRTRSGESQAPE